jgi:hypothetical protein
MWHIKNRLKIILFSISFFIFVFHAYSLVQAGTISFEPPFICVQALDTFQVDIAVDSGTHNIHCFFVKVGFDRGKIAMDTVVEGPLLPGSGSTFFFYKDTSGFYDIMSCIIYPTNGFANGPGILATMQLIAGNMPGITTLHFERVILQDTLLDTIPAQKSDGLVIIMEPEGYHFGDVNSDGNINSADVSYIINYLFVGGPEPIPLLIIGDVNCDLKVNSADVIYLINYLFVNGSEPCDPCE